MERYLDSDLEDISNGTKTFQDIAKKYGTNEKSVRRAFYRRGFVITRRYFVITDNYTGNVSYAESVTECAKLLNVSRQTIYDVIKGKKIDLFEEMNIKVEVRFSGETEEEK